MECSLSLYDSGLMEYCAVCWTIWRISKSRRNVIIADFSISSSWKPHTPTLRLVLLTIIVTNAFSCLYVTADLQNLLTAVQIQCTAQLKHIRILCLLLKKYVKLRFVFRVGTWVTILKLLTQCVDGRFAHRHTITLQNACIFRIALVRTRDPA